MRITLNLATRPFADLGPAIKRLRIAMAAMAVVSIGLGIGLHLVHHSAELARARDHSLDGQIAKITRERQQYTDMMHQPDNAKLLTEVRSLNQIFDEKLFSWTLAMEDLETVLPGGVAVSSLEPVSKDGKVTLHLRVVGPRNREVDLVKNLEHSKRFLTSRIVNEALDAGEGQNNRAPDPVSESNRFNFDILADYNPVTTGELAGIARARTQAEKKPAQSETPHVSARPNSPLPLPQAAAPPLPQPGRAPYNGKSRPPLPRVKPPASQPQGAPQ